MKRLALLGIIFLLLVGCGSKETSATYDLKVLSEKVFNQFAFEETLTPANGMVIESVLGLDPETIADAILLFASGATSEQVLLLTFDSKDSADDGVEQLKQYLEDQIDAYESYNPKEAYRLKGAYLEQKEKVVVLIVSADEDLSKLPSIW